MITMIRLLHLTDAPDVSIPVRVHAPIPAAIDWSCRVEIGWPGKPWGRDVTGVDAIHALELALRMVGTELYSSDLHAKGRLIWLEPGDGYGFPVPRTIRDLLVGQDRERFG
jgi:hypothetical protein